MPCIRRHRQPVERLEGLVKMYRVVTSNEVDDSPVHGRVGLSKVSGQGEHIVLGHGEKATGKWIFVQVPPYRHDALVLLGIDHAVELIDDRKERSVEGFRWVTLTRQHADSYN